MYTCIYTLDENNYYLCQGGYVIVVICLSVCYQLCTKTSKHICMKFSGNFLASEQMIKFWWQSGSPSGTGIVSCAFITIGRYGKWLMDIHSYWFGRWRHW